MRQVHEETKGSMGGKDPDTGEARFDGPPRASQRREDANHTWFFDSERQPVSAISSEADGGSPNPSDPEALVHASRGVLRGRPAKSVEEAAGLLAGLVGTSVLEIHCPNLDAWHILISHLGVAMLCALAGLIIGLAVEVKGYAFNSFNSNHKGDLA